MDKLIGNTVKKVMGDGEKKAPVKSIKLKIKFHKPNNREFGGGFDGDNLVTFQQICVGPILVLG